MHNSLAFNRVLALVAGACVTSIAAAQSVGPDVIVGDLPDFSSWGTYQGISAFSVGTTSCNIGNRVLRWESSNNFHPVIGQNLYRHKMVNGAGQFEMIGQSFLKHGFTALNGNICGACATNDGTGATLDPTCSDPYSASLNGSQTRLGPKSQVNAFTGVYPYPFTATALPASNATGLAIARRCQIKNTDLNPTLNTGATYFSEGHYIAADDAAANNGLNNASYRRVRFTGTDPNYTLATVAGFTTQRTQPAIYGWKSVESDVQIINVDVPSEGRFIVAYKVTPIAGGMYHYEYAVLNFNSDRSGASFALNFDTHGDPSRINITNVGFHDVDYHSGEPYASTDWTAARGSDNFGWSTQPYATNQNANALRWSSMYTFRFDSDQPPTNGSATIGLFKPGTQNSVTFAGLSVPTTPPCIGDHNVDSAIDGSDVESFFTDWESGANFADTDQSGGVDGFDVEMFFVHWEGGC